MQEKYSLANYAVYTKRQIYLFDKICTSLYLQISKPIINKAKAIFYIIM